MDNKQNRIKAYIALAQMLQKPNDELLELIKSTEFQELWQQIESVCGVQFPKSWGIGALPSLQEWSLMWDKTMGPITPLAEPIESLYKVWTTDPSCELSFANQKGFLKSDWACHMEDLFKKAGFEIPAQFSHCPDHLILELEFASFLIETATINAQLKFAQHHFDWLEDLCEAAKNKDVPQMYQDLYKFCKQFIQADMANLT